MIKQLGWGVAMAVMVVGGCVGIGPAVAPAAGRVQVIAHHGASADDGKLAGAIAKQAGNRETLTSEQRRQMLALIEASGSHNLELREEVVFAFLASRRTLTPRRGPQNSAAAA